MTYEEISKKIEDGEFEEVAYGTTGTTAYFDPETEQYYNRSGQHLRSPQEYHNDSDSYYENQDYDN